MTFGTAVSRASGRLAAVSDTPLLDAHVLLAHAAGVTKEQVFASYRVDLPGDAAVCFADLLRGRERGTPVAYLVGRKEFYGNDYLVDERVLIPRPDTETLVEAVLHSGPHDRILDVGTGSGCIAITLARELPHAEVVATDASRGALEVCRKNAERILGRSLRQMKEDLFPLVAGTFDCIVTNPPYLTDEEWARSYGPDWPEPESALRAGVDGLDLIRRIVSRAPDVLSPGGRLFLEASPHQFVRIRELCIRRGFSDITLYQDLAGRDRVVGALYGTHAQTV